MTLMELIKLMNKEKYIVNNFMIQIKIIHAAISQ